ncbi:hypothetical protein EXN22_04055 [Pseudomonas tructae]|uniref:Uncharacterized protein n=1 Tax=Pseudomonas tructae TaxID=2518644 RepID=A0A411MDK1_9PSED|nr:hypothetical protein [Pseudomonas tructae]QBF24908.1 hypothetical protein EXN22_04055 [Pseudomonas tructae]
MQLQLNIFMVECGGLGFLGLFKLMAEGKVMSSAGFLSWGKCSKKIEQLFYNKLMVISGWGAGLGVLFSLFSHRVSISSGAFMLLDGALALSTAVFFLLLVYAFATFISIPVERLEAGGLRIYPVGRSRRVVGVGVSLFMMLSGLLLLGYCQGNKDVTKTAVVLGGQVFGVGFIFCCVGVVQLLRRGSNENS